MSVYIKQEIASDDDITGSDGLVFTLLIGICQRACQRLYVFKFSDAAVDGIQRIFHCICLLPQIAQLIGRRI
jgi:hypothetical protein